MHMIYSGPSKSEIKADHHLWLLREGKTAGYAVQVNWDGPGLVSAAVGGSRSSPPALKKTTVA